MGWRKGADVDQELWPIETFGGVSDEQFWDDLAADKPLATTARTAQADSGPGKQAAEAFPPPRPGGADRTAVPPAVQSVQAATAPSPIATQPYPAVTQPSPTATRPVRAARQHPESHGRRSAQADGLAIDEDPLTSPAYSLRAKGTVDRRSYQSSNRARDLTREQYEAPLSQETQVFANARANEARPDPLRPGPLRSGRHRADPLGSDGSWPGSPAFPGTTGASVYQPGSKSAGGHGGSSGYPYRGQAPSQPIQAMNTPPYGEVYGYRNPVSPAGDPRRADGNRGQAGPGGNGIGVGNSGSYHAYPPVNGYRGPYAPWGNGRRLGSPR